MVSVLTIVQIILAVLLVTLVLLARANTDAGGAFSQDGGTSAPLQKRGGELTLYRATILIALLFVVATAYPLLVALIQ